MFTKPLLNTISIFLGISSGSIVFFHLFDKRLEKTKSNLHEEFTYHRDQTLSHIKTELEIEKSKFFKDLHHFQEQSINNLKNELNTEKQDILHKMEVFTQKSIDEALLKLNTYIESQKSDIFLKITSKEDEISDKIAELIRYAKPVNIKKHIKFSKKD